MRKEDSIWERLADNSDLVEEPFPGQSIVEIVGYKRVLIENHLGVVMYTREKIVVKMKFGFIQICGNCLELCRMSREQLIICGTIETVILKRRE